MKTLVWQHLPCDDDAGRHARGGAAAASDRGPAVVPARPRRRRDRRPFPPAVARSPARSVQAHGHDRRGRAPGAGDRAARADRDPRRLRRRRHHVHRHPAAGARDARRRRRALHSRAAPRRLWPPAGGDRAAARRRRVGDRVGRLRHPRDRSGAAGARARRRPHHHRPSRARRRAAGGARRDQSEAVRLHVPGQVAGRRRRRAEAGAGALRSRRPDRSGCRRSSRSPRSGHWRTSCRSSGRTASSRGSGWPR